MTKVILGSISHGTLRTPDLLKAFADELMRLRPNEREHGGLIRDARAYAIVWEADHLNEMGSEAASEIVSEMQDALNEYAPPYAYFGANDGDGADFGFWLHSDFQQDIRDDGGLIVADLADIPEGYTGEALVINDHGNATLYAFEKGEGSEVWAVV